MTRSRFWLIANLVAPLVALAVVAVVVVTFVSARQNQLPEREAQLAHLEVGRAAAESVIPDAVAIAELIQTDPEVEPEVLNGRPETVIASSVSPAGCVDLWVDAVEPAMTIQRWSSTSGEGTVLGVATRALVYDNRPTAREMYAQLGELLDDCRIVTLSTVETAAERTDEYASRSFETDAGVPGYEVEYRTSYALADDTEQGWLGVTRYYLAGDAIFQFTYWYDAASDEPARFRIEATDLEERLAALLP